MTATDLNSSSNTQTSSDQFSVVAAESQVNCGVAASKDGIPNGREDHTDRPKISTSKLNNSDGEIEGVVTHDSDGRIQDTPQDVGDDLDSDSGGSGKEVVSVTDEGSDTEPPIPRFRARGQSTPIISAGKPKPKPKPKPTGQ